MKHTRTHIESPIAKPRWSQRLYPLAELFVALEIVTLALLVLAFASVKG